MRFEPRPLVIRRDRYLLKINRGTSIIQFPAGIGVKVQQPLEVVFINPYTCHIFINIAFRKLPILRHGELCHEPAQGFQLAADIRLHCGLHVTVLHHLLFQFPDLLLNLLLFPAEHLFRYLIVHPHIKERLVAPLFLFQPLLHNGFVPQHFRLLHPCQSAAKHCRRFPVSCPCG